MEPVWNKLHNLGGIPPSSKKLLIPWNSMEFPRNHRNSMEFLRTRWGDAKYSSKLWIGFYGVQIGMSVIDFADLTPGLTDSLICLMNFKSCVYGLSSLLYHNSSRWTILWWSSPCQLSCYIIHKIVQIVRLCLQLALQAESQGFMECRVAVVGLAGNGTMTTCNLICASLHGLHENVTIIRQRPYTGILVLLITFGSVFPLVRLVILLQLLTSLYLAHRTQGSTLTHPVYHPLKSLIGFRSS